MAATQQDIREWFIRAAGQGATHMVVVCDTYDYMDYPIFVAKEQDVKVVAEEYHQKPMQRVMEIYDLSKDMEEQLNEPRAFNV